MRDDAIQESWIASLVSLARNDKIGPVSRNIKTRAKVQRFDKPLARLAKIAANLCIAMCKGCSAPAKAAAPLNLGRKMDPRVSAAACAAIRPRMTEKHKSLRDLTYVANPTTASDIQTGGL
jgi:hypothetical protein